MKNKLKILASQIQPFLAAGALFVSLELISAQASAQNFETPYHRTPRCIDGSCCPNPVTNGYYPTIWRTWPGNAPTEIQLLTPKVPRGIKSHIEPPTLEKELQIPLRQSDQPIDSPVGTPNNQPNASPGGTIVPDNQNPEMRQYIPQPTREKALPTGSLQPRGINPSGINSAQPLNNIQASANLKLEQYQPPANSIAIATQNIQPVAKNDTLRPAARITQQQNYQPALPNVKKISTDNQPRLQIPGASGRAGSINQIMLREPKSVAPSAELKITPEQLEPDMQSQLKINDVKPLQMTQDSIRQVVDLRENTISVNPVARAGSIGSVPLQQLKEMRQSPAVVQINYTEELPNAAPTANFATTQTNNDKSTFNSLPPTQSQAPRSGSISISRGVSTSNPLR